MEIRIMKMMKSIAMFRVITKKFQDFWKCKLAKLRLNKKKNRNVMIMQENLKRKKFKKIRFRKIEIPNTIN